MCGFSGYLLSIDLLGMLGRLSKLLAAGDLSDVLAQPANPVSGGVILGGTAHQ